MATNKTGIHNINEMRKAFVQTREAGNKSLVSKKLCEELGISEGYFTLYENQVATLYNTICAYTTVKHSVVATEVEKLKAREPIYPLWKELLSAGEKSKTSKELRCSETDIDSLVGYAEMFINDKNNVNDDKDFKSYKEIAHQRLARFRKDIETLLGIRIAKVEVMDDNQRDFLMAQRKLINKRKKIQMKLDVSNAQLLTLNKIPKPTEEIQAQIDELKKTIEGCTKSITATNETLKTLKPKADKPKSEAKTEENKAA